MNKIKNFLYDTNDIIVAAIVICCAALVITVRVDAIMSYPERALIEQGSQGGGLRPEIHEPQDPYEPVAPEEPGEPGEPGEGDEDPADDPAEEVVNHSLYIAFGQSMNTIADNLIQLGFFENRQDFTATVERLNAGQRIQAGTFIIPSDSTKEKVIEIISGN